MCWKHIVNTLRSKFKFTFQAYGRLVRMFCTGELFYLRIGINIQSDNFARRQ